MSEPGEWLQRLSRAREHIDPGLSDREVERLVEGAGRRVRRRARRRAGWVAVAVSGTALAVVVLLLGRRPFAPATAPAPVVRELALRNPAPAEPEPVPPAVRAFRLGDGSLATPLDTGSEIKLTEESRAHVAIDILRGRERFEVTPVPGRSFSVRAGDVTVTVVGTVFTVERVADRVGVTVERGTVRVEWGVGGKLLHQGDSGWFPPLVVESGSEPSKPTAARDRLARSAVSVPSLDRTSAAKRDTAEDLFLAADSARLAGHPDEGASFLRRLLKDYPSDPRAPLAAFTLGRMLLMELARPREAAAAFAQVRRLAPEGSFAEDALAREVEAWNRAGEPSQAQARAQEYLRLYPGGRRADAVKSMGRIQ